MTPPEGASMKRTRRRHDRQGHSCFECWFTKAGCHQGTIPGCCINCGKARLPGPIQFAQPLCNNDLTGFLYGLAEASNLSLLDSDPSSFNTMTIQSTTSRGFSGPHSFDFPGPLATRNSDLTHKIDQIIASNYALRIREATTTMPLISSAVLARGYFCILFSAAPTIEHERTIYDNCSLHYTHNDNHLSLHLMNFILARIDELVTEVLCAVRTSNSSHDNAYSFDVAGAAGILYTGLMHVIEGLDSGMLQPLCGRGGQLVEVLRRQVHCIADEVIQRQRAECARFENWAEHIGDSLDHLRCNVYQQSLVLTLERRIRATNVAKTNYNSFGPGFPPIGESSQTNHNAISFPHPGFGGLPAGSVSKSASPDSGYISGDDNDDNSQQLDNVTWSQY